MKNYKTWWRKEYETIPIILDVEAFNYLKKIAREILKDYDISTPKNDLNTNNCMLEQVWAKKQKLTDI